MLRLYCPTVSRMLTGAGVSFERWNLGRCEAVLCSRVAATANTELDGYAVFAVMDVSAVAAEVIGTWAPFPPSPDPVIATPGKERHPMHGKKKRIVWTVLAAMLSGPWTLVIVLAYLLGRAIECDQDTARHDEVPACPSPDPYACVPGAERPESLRINTIGRRAVHRARAGTVLDSTDAENPRSVAPYRRVAQRPYRSHWHGTRLIDVEARNDGCSAGSSGAGNGARK